MYWVTGVLGLLLVICPFIFAYSDNAAALWTSVIAGFLIAIASLIEKAVEDKENWEYWVAAVIGIFTIVSPFIFGFNDHATALLVTMVIGVLVTITAASRLWVGPSAE